MNTITAQDLTSHFNELSSAEVETVLSADEAAFLASYRNCSKKGQKAIRQLALIARNGLPMASRLYKLKGSP